jgi:hypothetical protein
MRLAPRRARVPGVLLRARGSAHMHPPHGDAAKPHWAGGGCCGGLGKAGSVLSGRRRARAPAGEWVAVRLPWHAFVPVKRARVDAGAPPLNPVSVRQLGLVLSRFEFNGFPNVNHRPGCFELQARPRPGQRRTRSQPSIPLLLRRGRRSCMPASAGAPAASRAAARCSPAAQQSRAGAPPSSVCARADPRRHQRIPGRATAHRACLQARAAAARERCLLPLCTATPCVSPQKPALIYAGVPCRCFY